MKARAYYRLTVFKYVLTHCMEIKLPESDNSVSGSLCCIVLAAHIIIYKIKRTKDNI